MKETIADTPKDLAPAARAEFHWIDPWNSTPSSSAAARPDRRSPSNCEGGRGSYRPGGTTPPRWDVQPLRMRPDQGDAARGHARHERAPRRPDGRPSHPASRSTCLAVRERVRTVIDNGSGQGATPFARAGIDVFEQEARILGPHEIELADGSMLTTRDRRHDGFGPISRPCRGSPRGPSGRPSRRSGPDGPASLAILGGGAIGVEVARSYARLGPGDPDRGRTPHPARRGRGRRGQHLAHPRGRRDRVWSRHPRRSTTVARARNWWTGEADPSRGAPRFDGWRPSLAATIGAAGVERTEAGTPALDDVLRTTAQTSGRPGTSPASSVQASARTRRDRRRDLLAVTARDYRVVPRVTFCDPEVASVGERGAAREAGLDVRVGCPGSPTTSIP